jgi:hypothetical protein
MGIRTGIDLPHLLQMSRRLPALLGHELPGQVAKAGRYCDLHPTPDTLANADIGTEHVAHPVGAARILVVETEGSV